MENQLFIIPIYLRSPSQYEMEAKIKEQNELFGEHYENFCDIGWRVPLSIVLHDVKDKEERIRLLDLFFAHFQDYNYK